METALQNQIIVTIPNNDLDIFTRLAKQFKWITMPVQAQSKQMTDGELQSLAEEIKSSMNPNAPKISMSEIVQEVRDYRNGK